MTGALPALPLLTAAANRSNDNPKGVATLGGAGVTGVCVPRQWVVVATRRSSGIPMLEPVHRRVMRSAARNRRGSSPGR
jgi:hypothetical protein